MASQAPTIENNNNRSYYSHPQHSTLSHSVCMQPHYPPQRQAMQQFAQQQQQQQRTTQTPAGGTQPTSASRNEALLAMRKHRSLDGDQFLSQFDSPPTAYSDSDAYRTSGYTNAPPYVSDGMKYYRINPNFYYGSGEAYALPPPPLPEYVNAAPPPPSGSVALDNEILRRECDTLNQKLGYVMNSIRTFWSPELKKERQLRKEEALRIGSLQYKLSQQAAEIQRVRAELEKREKDIGQLLVESDFGEMGAELRRLRANFRAAATGGSSVSPSTDALPRDFTDKTPTVHELQAARTKMERSELMLAERARELAACEMRLKCAEEQNAELEKRVEILTRGGAASDAQLRLLHDDLDVLRRKLEAKNQQIDSRDRQLKAEKKELEAVRTTANKTAAAGQEAERQISALTHRIDQLETLLRDRDAIVDRLKQRLAASADARAEAEMAQRVENAEHDRVALQTALDDLRRAADAEKAEQLQVFQEETRQLRATIENLQKELTDRHVLIVSQNEKIAQLDAELSGAERPTTAGHSQVCPLIQAQPEELNEARNEVGRLLSIVRQLEAEKSTLVARLNGRAVDGIASPAAAESSSNAATAGTDVNAILSKRSGRDTISDGNAASDAKKIDTNALQLRIEALEEALRESVGITSERDRLVAEQKRLIQQLSNQVSELFKNCGGKDLQKLLQETLRRADSTERALRDERAAAQRQIAGLRKEVILAVIREKDACIQLLDGSPEAIRDKVDVLTSQREQLKHRLLAVDNQSVLAWDVPPPAVSNVYGSHSPVKAASALDLNAVGATIPPARASGGYSVHWPPPTVALSTFQPDGAPARGPPYGALPPINIAVPAYGASYGVSAPASLNYSADDGLGNDGIWA